MKARTFTNKGDRDMVQRLYVKQFEVQSVGAEWLNYGEGRNLFYNVNQNLFSPNSPAGRKQVKILKSKKTNFSRTKSKIPRIPEKMLGTILQNNQKRNVCFFTFSKS